MTVQGSHASLKVLGIIGILGRIFHLAFDMFSLNTKQPVLLTMMCVFGRLMSELADVNTHSTVGMFHFYDVLDCTFCAMCIPLFVHCGPEDML